MPDIFNVNTKTGVSEARDFTAEELLLRTSDIDAAPDRLRQSLKSAIKAEASRRILELYPVWKQANMNAEATFLQEIRLAGETLSDAQETKRAELMAGWALIEGIRRRSDELETLLASMTEQEISGFDPSDPDHWD